MISTACGWEFGEASDLGGHRLDRARDVRQIAIGVLLSVLFEPRWAPSGQ